jgi:hypothetical protein
VQFVLTSMLIYLAMALDFSQWAHKAMDKICQKYFWRGHKKQKGDIVLLHGTRCVAQPNWVALTSPTS